MSYHSGFEWEFTDPVTDELVTEVVEGILTNKEYYSATTPQNPWMGTYYVSGAVDAMLYNIGCALNEEQDLLDSKTMEMFVSKAPAAYQKNVKELITKVIIILNAKEL